MDVHRFSYLSRVAMSGLRETLGLLIYDFGIVVQASEEDEMPEQMLIAARMSKLDIEKCPELPSETALLAMLARGGSAISDVASVTRS